MRVLTVVGDIYQIRSLGSPSLSLGREAGFQKRPRIRPLRAIRVEAAGPRVVHPWEVRWDGEGDRVGRHDVVQKRLQADLRVVVETNARAETKLTRAGRGEEQREVVDERRLRAARDVLRVRLRVRGVLAEDRLEHHVVRR